MATFGELKTRVAGELVRDDFAIGGDRETDTARAINSAVKEHRDRAFWFTNLTVTTPTVANQNYITRPATIGTIKRVSIPAIGMEIYPVDLTEIEEEGELTAQTGQPYLYAEGEAGAQLRLYPTPGAVYTVKITGYAEPAELSASTDTNIWTTNAPDLIAATARKILCRDIMRDAEGAQLAALAEQTALSALNRRNVTRTSGKLRASL